MRKQALILIAVLLFLFSAFGAIAAEISIKTSDGEDAILHGYERGENVTISAQTEGVLIGALYEGDTLKSVVTQSDGQTELTMAADGDSVSGFVWENGGAMRPMAEASCADAIVREVSTDWQMVWNDEFNSDALDTEKWNAVDAGGGFGNAEEQYYRPENASVSAGTLKIQAKKENHAAHSYTSAKLTTQGKCDILYGKISARIKMPTGKGLWPAFWMMPTDSEYGTWAASGEIDIMEARGRLPQVIGGALHYGNAWPNNVYVNDEYTFKSDTSIADFHTYSLEWEPGEMRWYVDGELYQTVSDWYTYGYLGEEPYTYPAPFDKEFYLILNLAVGGNYDGGLVPDASMLPATMEVDYVRVYTLRGRNWIQREETRVIDDSDAPKTPLAITGNRVYNGTFDKYTASRMAYWEISGLSARVPTATRVLTLSGEGSVSQGGIMLNSGENYTLSFDALSYAPFTVCVTDGGQTLFEQTFDVCEDTQTHGARFDYVGADTKTAKIEFIFADDSELDNVLLCKTLEAAPYPLKNGTFDLDLLGWSKFTQGASASFSVSNGVFGAQINSLGSEAWHAMLMQEGIELVKGVDYTLSFDARSSVERDIEVTIENDSYYRYLETGSLMLDNEMSSFEYNFKMLSDDTVTLKFLLAQTSHGKTGNVYIDNVVLKISGETGKCPPTLTAGSLHTFLGEDLVLLRSRDDAWNVSSVKINGEPTSEVNVGEDTVTIDASAFSSSGIYTIEFEAEGYALARYSALINEADGNLVINGTMDSDAAWSIWNEAADWSSLTISDGCARVQINYNGERRNEWSVPYSWSTQFMQKNIALEKNKTYIVSFRAWCDVDRPIQTEMTNYTTAKTTYHITNDSSVVYSREFTPNTDVNLTLNFLLGNIEEGGATTPGDVHTVCIDDVRIVEKQ
ncbi:MAG: family 16 glycosylhydrolase [Clostridia bacterium]|nr:family 16 glycosylhydrolase [Clostridia bacterium]